ncbi:MAG: exo-beta-N-acetylmuramidase NamZ domain-containing protein [Bacteroidota bacterium]
MKNSLDNSKRFGFQSYTLLGITILFFTTLISACSFGSPKNLNDTLKPAGKKDSKSSVLLGNAQTDKYLPILQGKNVAIVGNQTSVLKKTHLIDSLLSLGVQIKLVFAPEHGFRGQADNGEHISNETDKKTGLKIVSLYGDNSKPTSEHLKNIDLVIYDIQDVGVRFYTYISTLHYVMEACAENGKKLLILDRPNPNGHYIDGPILKKEFSSFVGMHPVPVVYGMTVGEYAQMINGEKWLKNGIQCDITVIPCENYSHSTFYSVPIAPSPNLKTDWAIALYPSLCFFEGTTISMGRGTDRPFEIYGHPKFDSTSFSFTPTPRIGSKNPPFMNQICFGIDCVKENTFPMSSIDLRPLIKAKNLLNNRDKYINSPSFFNKLAGDTLLKYQIENNISEEEIRNSWIKGLEEFKVVRSKYLLYD